MKNSLHSTFLLLALQMVFLLSYSQCAQEYVGEYGGRSCSVPDVQGNYSQVIIDALNDSSIVIRNFANFQNEDICNIEDTIVAHLNCETMVANFVFVNYDLCVVPASLQYFGEGVLYTDSIYAPFTQCNPDGTQEICRVFKKGAYVGVAELPYKREVVFYPNPTSAEVSFKDMEISEGTKCRILDAQGKSIALVNIRNNMVDLTNFSEGFYFLELLIPGDLPVRGRVFKRD